MAVASASVALSCGVLNLPPAAAVTFSLDGAVDSGPLFDLDISYTGIFSFEEPASDFRNENLIIYKTVGCR